jgi:hypothetical protein
MIVNSISLRITNFDNGAMQDHRTSEVCRILRELADCVERNGVVNAFDGTRLRDYNGNSVGYCECDWEEETADE